MSQIMRRAGIGITLVTAAALLTACGSSTENSKTAYNSATGNHTVAWKWAEHPDKARADLNVCKECHGQDLDGGIAKVACGTCHVNGIAAMTGCVSCHQVPPAGAAAPDRRGAHLVHNALVNVTGICDSCHAGAGTGSYLHGNGMTDVTFLGAYNAKSGPAVRNADGTCSNASCHGGQATPVWNTGMIDVNNQCASCHEFAFNYNITQYNNYTSGQHYYHVVIRGMGCFSCHDTTKLAVNHFTTLDTQVMEGPASATIQDYVGYVSATSTCMLGCHKPEIW